MVSHINQKFHERRNCVSTFNIHIIQGAIEIVQKIVIQQNVDFFLIKK